MRTETHLQESLTFCTFEETRCGGEASEEHCEEKYDAEQDAGPNDEERDQPHVPMRSSLARSSSSVSSPLGQLTTYHVSLEMFPMR